MLHHAGSGSSGSLSRYGPGHPKSVSFARCLGSSSVPCFKGRASAQAGHLRTWFLQLSALCPEARFGAPRSSMPRLLPSNATRECSEVGRREREDARVSRRIVHHEAACKRFPSSFRTWFLQVYRALAGCWPHFTACPAEFLRASFVTKAMHEIVLSNCARRVRRVSGVLAGVRFNVADAYTWEPGGGLSASDSVSGDDKRLPREWTASCVRPEAFV